jgi:hypothetical protein
MKTILGLFKIEALEEDELETASDAIKPDKTDLPNLRLEIGRNVFSTFFPAIRRVTPVIAMPEQYNWRNSQELRTQSVDSLNDISC